MRKTTLIFVLIGLGTACGDDDGGTTTDESTVNISPGAGIQTTVQTALLNAKDGQTLIFAAGTYDFTDELSLVGKKRITIKGAGTDREAVIWNFKNLTTGSPNGFSADHTDDIVIQGLTILDPPGDGLKVTNSTNVTFRNLHVKWSAGSVNTNGAYALYPVLSNHILVEGCLVEGASDAGIYVGQSTVTMVRNNVVKGNVTGIEIENTDDAEVMNNMAMDNVAGILVFNLPNLMRKSGSRTVVHDNVIMANNRPQFAHGGVVQYVPAGSGMILLANDNAEIRNNMITGNNTDGIIIASCPTVATLSGGGVNCADGAYDSFPEGLFIHDNTFSGNATMGSDVFAIWAADIIWDGLVDSAKPASDANKLCIKGNGSATFAKVNTTTFAVESRDLGPYDCTHAALAGVNVTWGQ